MKKIIIATNNMDKIREIKEILNEYEILTLHDLKINIEFEENRNTFKGNALKKAKKIFELTNIPSIADDSGLCIDVFDGWPGVKTARFLGTNSTQEDRNNYIISKMKGKEGTERKAKVICDIAYVDIKNVIVVEASINGTIAKNKKGNNGFGFDCIFELSDGRTLAELTSKEKNALSSRRKALEKLKKNLSYKKI